VIATELGKALAEKGHAVHFITYRQPARLDTFHQNVFYHEVRLTDYPLFDYAPYETALTSKIVDIARFEDLDLLHVHYAIPHAATAFMAKQILKGFNKHLPVITTLHGTDITLVGRDTTYEPVVNFSINQSDGVTTVSQSLKDDTLEHFDIKNEIRVIPNFIDFSRFERRNKEHFKKALAPNGERIIMHTSNFRKVKRVEDVVYMFAKVTKEVPSKLLLVGDGPERPAIERLCRDVEPCDDIRFLGKQEAVEELLAIADLFVLPSETESFGLAALEAMACRVPVISSNTGGIPEINIHGETGFMSNVGDTSDMAANGIKILQKDEILEGFRDRAYEQAKKFDIHLVLPQYEEYYKEITENRSITDMASA